jgi:DNA-binding MarR family transcriptional regulator
MRLTRRLRRERQLRALASAKLMVLGELHRSGERTPGQLAEADRIQPQSLSRTLAALERDGLIYRRRDIHDGRRSWVGLTGEGLEALSDDMAERDEWLGVQIARLSPAERAVLMIAGELMERLADEGGPLESVEAA